MPRGITNAAMPRYAVARGKRVCVMICAAAYVRQRFATHRVMAPFRGQNAAAAEDLAPGQTMRYAAAAKRTRRAAFTLYAAVTNATLITTDVTRGMSRRHGWRRSQQMGSRRCAARNRTPVAALHGRARLKPRRFQRHPPRNAASVNAPRNALRDATSARQRRKRSRRCGTASVQRVPATASYYRLLLHITLLPS